MPQIGWLEILIIASIAIIVVGPKDFPIMLKKVGSWIGTVKRYESNVRNHLISSPLEFYQSVFVSFPFVFLNPMQFSIIEMHSHQAHYS